MRLRVFIEDAMSAGALEGEDGATLSWVVNVNGAAPKVRVKGLRFRALAASTHYTTQPPLSSPPLCEPLRLSPTPEPPRPTTLPIHRLPRPTPFGPPSIRT